LTIASFVLLLAFAGNSYAGENVSDVAGKLSAQKERFEKRVFFEFGGKLKVYTTEHWLIATNLPENAAADAGKVFERAYSLFFKLMGGLMKAEEKPASRMAAFILANDSFRAYYYGGAVCGIFIPFNRKGNFERVVFHEATHQLHFERTPCRRNTWLVEGLAMLFQSYSELEEDQAEKAKGLVPIYLGQLKENLDKITVSELTEMSYDAFHNSENELLHYCASGALVHFLLFGADGKYKSDFENFLRKETPEDLFKCLGVDAATLDKKFREYVPLIPNFPNRCTGNSANYTRRRSKKLIPPSRTSPSQKYSGFNTISNGRTPISRRRKNWTRMAN
jgi:hypothetical protein